MKRARRRIPIYTPGQDFQVERFTPMHQPLVHPPQYFPHSALSKHHAGGGGGGGGGLSFIGLTSWNRPLAKVGMNPVPFVDKAGLTTAITNMVGGDYIFYNGSGPLNIQASGADGYHIGNKNPSSPVVIDLGTRQSIWNPSIQSNNYVAFNFTGSGGFAGLSIDGCSNLTVYGGDVTSNYFGVTMNGPTHNFNWYDGYIHDVGNTGFHLRGNTGSGVGADVGNNTIRVEVNRFCMNPATDTAHNDRGTGAHAFLFHDSSGGDVHDNIIALYGHDSLQPGEFSYGVTWPEGGGGSCCEIGSPSTSETNNTFYLKGENLGMIPNGTNPGSTAQQTGGNVINAWGNVKMNGMVIAWLEGNNCTGQLLHAAGGSYWPGSPAVKILHGRWHNVALSTAGSNQPEPYATQTVTGSPLGFDYQDMQAV